MTTDKPADNQITFFARLSHADWRSDLRSWHCSALKIPSAEVQSLYSDGQEIPTRRYRVDHATLEIAWVDSAEPPTHISAKMTVSGRLVSHGKLKNEQIRVALIGAFATVLAAVITGVATQYAKDDEPVPNVPCPECECYQPPDAGPDARIPDPIPEPRRRITFSGTVPGQGPGRVTISRPLSAGTYCVEGSVNSAERAPWYLQELWFELGGARHDLSTGHAERHEPVTFKLQVQVPAQTRDIVFQSQNSARTQGGGVGSMAMRASGTIVPGQCR